MKMAMGAVIAFICLLVGCERWEVGLESETIAGKKQNEMWMVEYGWFKDEDPDLAYAVFSRKTYDGTGLRNQTEVDIVGRSLGSNTPQRKRVFLLSPDGKKMQLPGMNQVFDIADGELVEFECRVTLREFKEFFSSTPARVTASALLDYVQNLRRVPARQEPSQGERP
jgi:hypothetical protein